MFHHFHGGEHQPDGHGSLSAEEFEAILIAAGVDRILGPREWLDRMRRGALLESDLCITFDDALLSQFDVCLPVLEHLRLEAFWFIYSAPFEGVRPVLDIFRRFRYQCYSDIQDYYRDFWAVADVDIHRVCAGDEYQRFLTLYSRQFPFYSANDIRYRFVRDRVLGPSRYQVAVHALMQQRHVDPEALSRGLWMADEHLRRLHGKGHIIGLHSFDHPTALAALNPSAQRAQYVRNFEHIARVCETPVAVAHPCNSYSDATLAILTELGITCGFRSSMTPPANKGLNPSPLELARVDSALLRRHSASPIAPV